MFPLEMDKTDKTATILKANGTMAHPVYLVLLSVVNKFCLHLINIVLILASLLPVGTAYNENIHDSILRDI